MHKALISTLYGHYIRLTAIFHARYSPLTLYLLQYVAHRRIYTLDTDLRMVVTFALLM